MDALNFHEGARLDLLEQLDVQGACCFVDLRQGRYVNGLQRVNLRLAHRMLLP